MGWGHQLVQGLGGHAVVRNLIEQVVGALESLNTWVWESDGTAFESQSCCLPAVRTLCFSEHSENLSLSFPICQMG